MRGNFTAPIDAGVPGAADTYTGDFSAGDTWYVRVDGARADTGDFTLSVQGPWPSRPSGAASVATLYTNQNGDATLPAGQIAGPGQFDLYHVAFGSAGTATFHTTGSTDTLMAYYSSYGAPTLTDDDDGAGVNALVSTGVSAARDLELLVGGYGASTGAYGLSVDGPSPSVSAVSIAPGYNTGSANGSIGSSAEADFYTFAAPEAGSWTVTVTPASGFHPTMSVYDAAGAPIGGSFTDPLDAGLAGATVVWTGELAEGDAVYVRVDGLGSATGSYGLAVEGPANNVPVSHDDHPLRRRRRGQRLHRHLRRPPRRLGPLRRRHRPDAQLPRGRPHQRHAHQGRRRGRARQHAARPGREPGLAPGRERERDAERLHRHRLGRAVRLGPPVQVRVEWPPSTTARRPPRRA